MASGTAQTAATPTRPTMAKATVPRTLVVRQVVVAIQVPYPAMVVMAGFLVIQEDQMVAAGVVVVVTEKQTPPNEISHPVYIKI